MKSNRLTLSFAIVLSLAGWSAWNAVSATPPAIGIVKGRRVPPSVGRLPQIAKIVVVIGRSGDVNIAGIKPVLHLG